MALQSHLKVLIEIYFFEDLEIQLKTSDTNIFT